MSELMARKYNTLAAEMPVQMTLRHRLEDQKQTLSERLAHVIEAINLLDKNPELEAFHDAITKAGY